MANFSIDALRGAITNPARSHLFRCSIDPGAMLSVQFPEYVRGDKTIFSRKDEWLVCRNATIPEMVVDVGEIYYFTRAVKHPGRRFFSPLILNFFNTTDYKLRGMFETWNQLLSSPVTNQGLVFDDPNRSPVGAVTSRVSNRALDFTATITIEHYDVTGQLIYQYKFFNAFPSNVGTLTFGYDNDSEIQTFDVQFAYNYMIQNSDK